MISVAMATYNGEKYIREQIDSILNQTVQDFELVVCDDCSSDGTWSILEDYSNHDNRIKVFRNEGNLGFKKNFEKVISLTCGDYVALCDQDDIWTDDYLEVLLNEMKDGILVVCGRPLFVDEHNKELPPQYDYLKMDRAPISNDDTARHVFLGRSSYQGASMLIRKSFFDIALPIPDGTLFHDSWFAALACVMDGFVYVNKYIMRYRRLKLSVTYNDMYVSAFRRFVRHTLHNNILPDRIIMIREIRERIPNMNSSQRKMLQTFETMHLRKNSVLGRIQNLPYRLYHFRSIYANDGIHIFS
jgi:glycosyltransferase involved in cell wall biosynthesis